MSKINIPLIKKLREATGAPVVRVQKVLLEIGNDEKKAYEILKKEGFEKAGSKTQRATKQGIIAVYAHHSGKIASLVELLCETDFVARNELFGNLGRELCLQVASMQATDADELLLQDYIKDPSKKVSDLVKEVIVKTGENIKVGRIVRLELGEA